jgi:hypothetical protein
MILYAIVVVVVIVAVVDVIGHADCCDDKTSVKGTGSSLTEYIIFVLLFPLDEG